MKSVAALGQDTAEFNIIDQKLKVFEMNEKIDDIVERLKALEKSVVRPVSAVDSEDVSSLKGSSEFIWDQIKTQKQDEINPDI